MTIPRIGSRDIEQLHRSLEADVPHVRASEKHRATRPYDARDASHADPSRAYDMSALDAAATAAETSNTQEAYSTLMKEILRLEVSAVENHEAARYWAYQATAYIFYKDLKSAVDCGVQSYYLDQTCAALGLELKVRVALKILESKPQEAIALLEPVLRIRPNHREALEGLVKALHQMGPKKQESKMAALQNLRDRYRDDSRLLELMDAVEMGEDFDRLRHCLHEAQKILRDGPLEPHEANAKQPVRLLNEAHCIAKDKGASGRTQGLLWRWSAIANFQFGKFEDAKRHFLMATKLDAETTEYISKTPAVTTATVIDPDFLPHSLVSAFIKLMHSWKIDQQNGHLEEWRAKIKEGDAVDVWSQSHGAWVKGEVEATDGEIVTAALCNLGFYKKVHRTSTHIRLPQVTSATDPSLVSQCGSPHSGVLPPPVPIHTLSATEPSKNTKLGAGIATTDLHGTASTNHSSSASSPHEGQFCAATTATSAHNQEVQQQEQPRATGCASEGNVAINGCHASEGNVAINGLHAPEGGAATNGRRAPERGADTDVQHRSASSSRSASRSRNDSCGAINWFDGIAALINKKKTPFASRVTIPPIVQPSVAQSCTTTTKASPRAGTSNAALQQHDIQDHHTLPVPGAAMSAPRVVSENGPPRGATITTNNSGATPLKAHELPRPNICQSAEKYMKNVLAVEEGRAETKREAMERNNASVTPAYGVPRSASPPAHGAINAHRPQSPPLVGTHRTASPTRTGSNGCPTAPWMSSSSDTIPLHLLNTQLCTYPAAKTLTASRSMTPRRLQAPASTEADGLRVVASTSSSSAESSVSVRKVEVEVVSKPFDGEYMSAPGSTAAYTSSRPYRSSGVMSTGGASGLSPSAQPLFAPSIRTSTSSGHSAPAFRASTTSEQPTGIYRPSVTTEQPAAAHQMPTISRQPAPAYRASANTEQPIVTSAASSLEQPKITPHYRTASPEQSRVTPQYTPAPSVIRRYTPTSQEQGQVTLHYRTASPPPPQVSPQHNSAASTTSASGWWAISECPASTVDTVVAAPVAAPYSIPAYAPRTSPSYVPTTSASHPSAIHTRTTTSNNTSAPLSTTPPYVSTGATQAYSSAYSPSIFTPAPSYATSASPYVRMQQQNQQPGLSAVRSFSPPAYAALQRPLSSSEAAALPIPPGLQRGVAPVTSASKQRPTGTNLSSATPSYAPAVHSGTTSAVPSSRNSHLNYNNHPFTLHKDEKSHKDDGAPMRRQWVQKEPPAPVEVVPRTSSPPPVIQHLRARPNSAASTTTIALNNVATRPRTISALGDIALDLKDLEYHEVLGKGGFGSVYRGLYKGQEVAIKKLHVEDGLGACCSLEFEKEVLTLQKLRHDRLVTMIGAISDSPNLIMVLEYMAGGSLYTLLHVDKEVLSPSRKQMLSTDMASGVTFLHDFKPPAVHRDLKSMNVVLDGSRQRCKICDFGLTQTMEKTHITRKDQEGGSPRYMCPELFDPKTKITEKVDVWALGCLIAETFTGRLPHQECQSLPQVMNKLLVQKQGPFSSPAPLVISGHKQLIDEIFAALELEVERRTTARKLLKALTLA
eukprot:GEMP01001051.1.p1 GENE.GEMP01001051.1~~GEMP01001051.1.p1  ORF type:complete len:1569 (+),score=383.42 GEMP01001051.1:447-5153(+)